MDGRALFLSGVTLLIVSLLWHFTDPLNWQLKEWLNFVLVCATFSIISTTLIKLFSQY